MNTPCEVPAGLAWTASAFAAKSGQMPSMQSALMGGVAGGEGGEGAQHLVAWLPVSISKYIGPFSSQPASSNGTAQSGHGHVSALGMHEPPVDAQQYVPWAHSPMHEVASSAVVQAAAQRGYASATPVSSLAPQ